MGNGKNICKYLKEVRKNIAAENNIPLEQTECTYKGECLGTCPHCEAEVQYIEQELAKKGKMNILGKAATIAGLTLSMAACNSGGLQIVGDVPVRGKIADIDTTHQQTAIDTSHQSQEIQEPLMDIVPVKVNEIDSAKTEIAPIIEPIDMDDPPLRGKVPEYSNPTEKSDDQKE
ncbi:MAG: hypothetical protein J6W06_11185 [Bacteroidales bacterium]|nr:hypothetical protein [Bacteroidales bacterium]